MSFFPRAFRSRLADLPLSWLVWLPLMPVIGGAVVVAGYLAAQQLLGGPTLVGLGLSLGGAIALSGLAYHQITQRLAALEARDQETQMSLSYRDRWLEQYSQLSPGNIYTLVQTTDGQVFFEYISLAIESIHEIPVEQILQDANVLLQRIHPEDQAAYQQAVRQSAEQLTPFFHQWRIMTPSGQVKWLQGNSQPERRQNGDIAWYGVVIEITSRQQAETALREHEKRYQAILNAIPDLIIRMRHDGTYLDIKLTNAFPVVVTREDVGRNIFDLLPEDVAHQRLKAAEQVLSSGQMQVSEFSFQIGEQQLWQEVRIVPLNQEEVVVIIRDLTQRMQMETALRQSETNLRQAQRIAQLGSWEFDWHTSNVTWSEEMFCIFGLTSNPTEPSYDQILAMIPPADREELERLIERAMADYTPYRFEHRIQRPDGTQRYIVSRGEVVDGAPPQGLKLCGTALDITERKQLEASLRSQAEEEHLITAITQNIRQSLDLDDILATTVNAIQQSLEADQVLIYRLYPDGSGQVIQEAVKDDYPLADQMRWRDDRFPPEVYEYYLQGQVRMVADVDTDPWANDLTNYLQQSGVKSKIVVPIIQGLGTESQPVWGLLMIHACSYYRQWQESEADLLQRLSDQLAIAIDQASLFQQLQSELAERRQTELALQESKTRFAEVAQTLNQVSYVISVPSAEYLYISPSYERLWGYSCDSLYRDRKSWLNKIHPEDLDYVLDGLNQLLEGTQKRLQYRIFAANGDIRWIESESLIVRDDEGNALRVVGIADDITDRKRLEQALRDNEELFRRAFDDAPIGISLISPEGRYLRVNKCYCDLLEYSQAELLQMHFQAITHPDDLAADLAGLQQMNQGEIPTFQFEKRYITKSGTVIPVILYASSIRDAEDTPLYSVGHVQDIREQLEVDRMKDEFVSIVSHELRTPITSIEGSLTLLGSGVYNTRPQKAKAMLDIAIQNSHRLVRLVDDILSFERLESGKVELMMESCQVEDLQQQAIDSVSAIADRAAVTLRMTPCSATLYAAPDALMQTLTNLLSNAIKFSNPRQMVWLEAQIWHGRVRAPEHSIESLNSPSDNPAQSVLFSVKDQGRGIPADKLDNIFDQFQQVDVSDARQKGGTGLGLAICKRIVQQHGGDLWVESQLGQGSTFYFTVPLWQAGDREIEQENQLSD